MAQSASATARIVYQGREDGGHSLANGHPLRLSSLSAMNVKPTNHSTGGVVQHILHQALVQRASGDKIGADGDERPGRPAHSA